MRAWLLLAAAALTAIAAGSGRLDRFLLGRPDVGRDAGPVTGRAVAVDGDSLSIGRVRIRLEGIDAPELEQSCTASGGEWPCGRVAQRHLERLVGRDEVACGAGRLDQFGRLLAICWAAGRELNGSMVRDGMAVAFGDRYRTEEAAAREARAGVWRGDFEQPGDWRRRTGTGG